MQVGHRRRFPRTRLTPVNVNGSSVIVTSKLAEFTYDETLIVCRKVGTNNCWVTLTERVQPVVHGNDASNGTSIITVQSKVL
jgi:hypothetical protein